MKQTGFLIFFALIFALVYSQSNISYNIEKGADLMEQQYIEIWKKIKKTDGFRIQITSYAGANSKVSIEKIATQFASQFPDIPCYKSYFEPNFRLRVGDYRTKFEAYKALRKISLAFSGAFVLKEQVEFK
jgi:hypothetical protein